jgi:chemotaxis protein methyltransferase CheR
MHKKHAPGSADANAAGRPHDNENTAIEIGLLLEAIFLKYGYDFRNYAQSSIRRRIAHRLVLEKMPTVSDLTKGVLYDPELFARLLLDFSINVTEMFRDPVFFKTLRDEVAPVLRTYPHIKIWHAGCSTGEEVYSMAILLKEEGIYDRVQIYATDFNEVVLEKAKEGVFPLERMRDYTENYLRAGGAESFSEYYTARYGLARVDPSLRKRIVFAAHNLATDGVFGEMNLIMCRNVLIYFDRALQGHAVRLFADSLCHRGFLCIGPKENINSGDGESLFEPFVAGERIFRKR